MNPMLIAGVVINGFVTLAASSSGGYPDGLILVMGLFVALSVVGLIVIATGNKRLGAILAMIGCVIFVPIGLIGVFGGRKILDELKKEEFEVRRSQSGPTE